VFLLDLLHKYSFVSRKGEPVRWAGNARLEATGVAKTQRRARKERLLQEVYCSYFYHNSVTSASSKLLEQCLNE